MTAPDLRPHQVHLWRIHLDTPRAGLLSPEEQSRAARFRFDHDRRRWSAAHSALREILGACLAVPPLDLAFAAQPEGKPFLPGSNISFNLSHAAEFALIGVAMEVEIGVDIERIRPVPELEAIARRMFQPEDVAAILAAAPREPRFFETWTRYEAAGKARGSGIGSGMRVGGIWVRPAPAPQAYAASVASLSGPVLVVHH